MIDAKGILIKWGPQHLAKGLERGFEELDKVIVGWPVQPSLVANVGCAIAGAAGGLMGPSPWDDILAIWGGHHSTTLWDYLEAGLVPPPAAGLTMGNPAYVRQPRLGAYTRQPASGAYGRAYPELRQPYAGYAEYQGNPEGSFHLSGTGRLNPVGTLTPGGPVYGARWGPYQGPVTARAPVPTRPGLGAHIGTRPVSRAVRAKVTVGPYAGGLVAPTFIPGALRPKFQLGS